MITILRGKTLQSIHIFMSCAAGLVWGALILLPSLQWLSPTWQQLTVNLREASMFPMLLVTLAAPMPAWPTRAIL